MNVSLSLSKAYRQLSVSTGLPTGKGGLNLTRYLIFP